MKFVKMHGLGNDFVLTQDYVDDYAQAAESVCARHTGIGADGLIAVLPSDKADVRMRIINADGSEAQMCGNGIRCLARYAYDRGIVKNPCMTVETLAGIMRPEIVKDNGAELVRVDMGKPDFVPASLPILVDEPLSFQVEIDGCALELGAVCMGVPHAILFGEDFPEATIERLGPGIAGCGLFPEGVNVNFVSHPAPDELEVRTFERGAGRTLACGTGACASVVIANRRGMVGERVIVHLELGELIIEIAPDGNVYMTGPAVYVFEGNTQCE